MNKSKNENKEVVISFRVPAAVNKTVKREAKKRKQNRSMFVEALFIPALEAAVAAGSAK